MMRRVGGGLSAVPFVGREVELASLEDEMRHAEAGELRMALLVGDPGVGKSRLARELLGRLTPPLVGLHARARPLAVDVSFGLWAEAIDGYLRSLPPGEIRRACGPLLDELAVLVRSAELARESSPVRPARVLDLRDTLARFVERLAEAVPVIVLFDDVHWADAASVEALHTLGRTARRARVLVLLTARPVELARGDAPAAVLAAAEQDGVLRRHTLAALPQTALADLATAALEKPAPAALVDWLQRRSRGNPLFALSLLGAVVESGADLATPHLERVPDAVRVHVGLRLGALEADAVSVLELLAVNGRGIDPVDLSRMAGQPLGRVAVALERLVAAGLAREVEQGARLSYEVAHPLVQDAVYEGIGAARRRLLHRLAARTLAGGGRVAQAAPHFARAGEVGDAEAVEALCHAVRHAEQRGLHRDALSALRSLLALLPKGDRRWLDVLDAMPADAEWVFAHLAEVDAETGVAVMQRIDGVLEGTEAVGRRGAVQLRMASFLGLGLGELEAAERAARRAKELFDQAQEPHQALLAMNELGYVKAGGEGLESEAAIAREVLIAAESRGDGAARLQALCSLGSATLQGGRFDEAETVIRLATEVADQQGNAYRVAWLSSLSALACALEGRMDDALALSDRALATRWAADAVAYECRTVVEWLRGDLTAVVGAAGEAAARHAGRVGRRQAWAVELAARARLEAGDVDAAELLVGEALRAYGGRPFYIWGPSCDWVSGVLSFRRHRRVQAVEELHHACRRYRQIGFATYEAMALVDLAHVGAELGDPMTAATATDRLTALAGTTPSRFFVAMRSLAEAWHGVARGGGDEAAATAVSATVACRELGFTFYAAVALDAAGRSLVRHDSTRAVALLQEAADAFRRSGAFLREKQVVQLVSRLGSAGRRAASSRRGATSLTPREKEVARLAARGHTSREIGEELFIGPRTVETHIANVCTKLGLSSKRELVARRDQLGL
jgi:DNA-binding CsgD family transcriptional regulator/tetratricopeptide (TPR) repeat protein